MLARGRIDWGSQRGSHPLGRAAPKQDKGLHKRSAGSGKEGKLGTGKNGAESIRRYMVTMEQAKGRGGENQEAITNM